MNSGQLILSRDGDRRLAHAERVHPGVATLTRRRPGGRGADGSARDLVADGVAAKLPRRGGHQDRPRVPGRMLWCGRRSTISVRWRRAASGTV